MILEAEPEVGGLAAAFQVGGTRIERFYHHWFTNDHHVIELVSELGLARIGSSINRRAPGCILPISSIASRRRSTCLRFPALPFADRHAARLSRSCARDASATGAKSTISAPPNGSAQAWRRQGFSRRLGAALARQVRPSCRGRFGGLVLEQTCACVEAVAGRRGEEQLGYFRGGFAALADELVERIVRSRR